MLRTHTCGELRLKEKGKHVQLSGWLDKVRTHGGITFISLRDRYGITQIVLDEKHNAEAYKIVSDLRREDVLHITGKVRFRGDGLVNKEMVTGEIEILADTIKVLAKADPLPIEIDDKKPASEEMRLKYRYLDLRRPTMQHNLAIRHNVAQATREFLSKEGFLEIETPVLMKATPEGARDYVVPARVNPGKFYALPQSPQLYKQILMVSGFDRYFQLPRCMRDEDLRADRQPEHTQIDLEMSFVDDVRDIHEVVERMFKHIWKKVAHVDLHTPFPVLTHNESMERYGCDKPDLRFGMELADVSEIVKYSEFNVFKQCVADGGLVKGINVEKCGTWSRKQVDAYVKFAQDSGAKGLAWMKVTDKGCDGGISKFLSKQIQDLVMEKLAAKEGDLLLFCADTKKKTNDVMDKVRRKLGAELDLISDKDFKFCWITEFPLFEWDEKEEKWEPAHHMFCMPKPEHLDLIEKDPGKVYCTQYDLVLNGWEMGSGSIRINVAEIQERVMRVVGYPKEKAQERFGFLLDSFRYGAPPHGGIGIGFDRVVSLLLGIFDIREVIAFPKNKHAQCPMDGSPAEIEQRQMDELGLKFIGNNK
jgi:aspartyl-tRNA synthetase